MSDDRVEKIASQVALGMTAPTKPAEFDCPLGGKCEWGAMPACVSACMAALRRIEYVGRNPIPIKHTTKPAEPSAEALAIASKGMSAGARYVALLIDAHTAALTERLAKAEAERCRHGWRGAISEPILTPCPACGLSSIFVGTGGHLTCANLNCKAPVIADHLSEARADAATKAERERCANLVCQWCAGGVRRSRSAHPSDETGPVRWCRAVELGILPPDGERG